MREACVALARQKHDLALVPLANAKHQMHAFRALQPNLPIVTTTDLDDARYPVGYEDKFQGMLKIAELETTLPIILDKTWSEYDRRSDTAQAWTPSVPMVPSDKLQEICRELDLDGDVEHVIFSRSDQVVANCGKIEISYVEAITKLVESSWQGSSSTILIQYEKVGRLGKPVLLYTRPAAGQLLTLVAEINSSVGRLRKISARILHRMFVDNNVRTPILSEERRQRFLHGEGFSRMRRLTYAIAWRPIEPLKPPMQLTVRQIIQELAEEYGCLLTHLLVESDLVHMVVDCPPGRGSGWVAFTFKDGVEKSIKAQFGVETSLWLKGYFATESHQPLPRAILDLFLKDSDEQASIN
jgi:hypothetical protein